MAIREPAHELAELWRRARQILRHELGDTLYMRWIDKIRPISADENEIVLGCPSPEHRDDVMSRFGKQIANVLAFVAKVERPVEFIHGSRPQLAVERAKGVWPGDATLPEPSLVAGSLTLSRLHTFQNFVRANSNETAFQVAEGLANGTAVAANPLFVFGPTGMGKTHLLQAMVWRMLERHPGKRVLYLTADGFLHMFLLSLRAGDTQTFKDLVRNVDVLVIEDVQKLSGKTATAEEFFHTFDDLISRGKQVILSADGSPSLMAHLPERMRSRLVSGGGVEISPGDFTLRLALLNAIVKRRAYHTPSVSIDGQVLGMIAARLQTDARALTSAVERLISMSQDGAAPITFKSAEVWLHDFLREHNKAVSINDIKKRVTAFYKLRPGDVESPCRKSELVRGRQVVMYLARTMTPRSYPEIGKSCARDHTTVMHGFERIRDRRLVEPDLDAEIEAIKRSIRDHANDPGKNNSNN